MLINKDSVIDLLLTLKEKEIIDNFEIHDYLYIINIKATLKINNSRYGTSIDITPFMEWREFKCILRNELTRLYHTHLNSLLHI